MKTFYHHFFAIFLFVAASLAPPVTHAQCTPPAFGLVGWWQGDGTAIDLVSSNNGTLVNVAYSNGVVNQTFSFDPENYSYGTFTGVKISDRPEYALTNSLTIEGWIRPRGDSYVIFFRGDGRPGLDPYALSMNGNHEFWFSICNAGGNSTNIITTIPYNQWVHVAATLNGTNGQMMIYTNGVLAAQAFTTIRPFGALDNSQSPGVGIGNVNDGGNTFPFIGDVDEIALYNRALSQTEIQAIVTAGSAGKCTSVVSASNGVPAITSFTPTSGTNGALVTILGTNFQATAASNIVYFGAVKATVLTASANSLSVAVPVGTTFAPITVTTGGRTAYAKAAFLPKFAGNGSGISVASLSARQNLTAANGPISTVIADMDGDGKPDLVCANVFNNSVSIYRNISVGGTITAASFAARVDLPTTAGANTPNSVAVADVDGDGKLDIIIPEYSDNLVSVYRNNSAPGSISTNTFAARLDFVSGTSPYSAAVRDVDGDGRADILTVNNGAGTVSILRNTGGAGSNLFAAKVDYAVVAGSAFLDTGDLNGDGKPDLAVAGDGFVSVLQNKIVSPGALTTNSFARHLDLAIPSGGISVRLADLDGDGQPDLATTTYLSQIFSVLRNTGIGGNLTNSSFAPRIDYALSGRGHTLAFGDLDGDGKLDAAVVSELADFLSVFRNTSTPGVFTNTSLASQVEFATGWNAWGVSVGDLNGDGRPDVVLANQYDNNLSIYQNQVPFATNAPPPSCTTAPAGIVGWWSGENNSADNTGTNNGTLSASGASYAAGKVGQGFRFDGTNGSVQIPDSTSLKPASVTAEAWVYLDPNLPVNRGGEQIIFKKNTWTAFFEGYSLLKTTVDNGNGTFSERFEFTVSRTGTQVVIRSQTLAQRGVWFHVAATYDGNKSTLFVNGVAEATATAGFALDYDTTPVFIGTSGTWAPYLSMFGGIIDEAAIYNRALGTNEIAAIYAAGSAGKCANNITPPVITSQPASQTVTNGNTASFSVGTTGTSPLQFQWLFNGTNISGATNFSLVLSNVSLAQAGNYSVFVTNLAGGVASSNVWLTVVTPPSSALVDGNTPGFYNDSLSTILDGTSAQFPIPFSSGGGDPTFYPAPEPNLAPASSILGNWLNNPSVLNSNWHFMSVVPSTWNLNSETAIVYQLNGGSNGIASLWGDFDVDNGIYVWVNGVFKFGACEPGLPSPTGQFEYTNVYLGSLSPGTNYVQVLREDNGISNGYQVRLWGSSVATNPITAVCTAPAAGLVAWLAGEGNFMDGISGNTATNSGVGFRAGKVAQAFSFNVSNAAVILPASSALDVGAGTGFTLEAWIKPADLAQFYPIFEWNDLTYWGVHFFTGSSAGELYANIPDSFGTWHQMSSPGGVLLTNVFQHVALTYDKASGMATMYDNGQMVAQQNMGSFTPRTTSRDLYIGRRPAPVAEAVTFFGQLDEPSVYNRALTTNEIAAIYNAGSAGKCSMLAAPLVVTQPTNSTVTVNTTATFNVAATGTQPLFYQWSFNGTNILGATNTTLTLNNVTPSQAGNYSVLVSNFVGVAMSSNAALNVYVPPAPPFILSQTPSQVVLLNNAATFTVNAGGTAPLSYFWKKNNVLIPGATNFFYTISSAQFVDSGKKFSCLVTNAYGMASSTNSSLKVINTIYNDLCSGAVVITNASYTNTQSTATASSYGDPQPDCVDGFGNGVWYQFTAPVSGLLDVDTYGSDFDTGLAIYAGSCGALTQVDCNDDTDGFTSELVIQTTAGATYYFLVGGYSAHVGNLVFHLKHFTPPAFYGQPTNLAVIVSSNGTFSATLSGTQPIALQWYFNNTPLVDGGRISGVTNATLNLANVITNDGGNYYLVASNFVGVTTSSVAVLTPVILPPSIIVPPVAQSVLVGLNVNFFAVVDGTPPYSYQWYQEGTALAEDGHFNGVSTPSLTISNLTTADTHYYSLVVANVSGSVTSAPVLLTVLVPPVITLNPIGRSVPPGLPTIFTANATGIPAPSYQWQLNGTNVGPVVPGTTYKNYTNPAVDLGALGFYQVIASNSVGSVTSSVAQLTFGPVAAWGRNLNNESLPPPNLSNVVNVAGNLGASFALRTDGSVVAWGGGAGTNVPANATNAVAIFGSGNTAAAVLRADGTVVGWNMTGMPVLTNVVSLSVSNNSGTAVRADGSIMGWAVPSNPFNAYNNFPINLSHIKAVSIGYPHGLALKDDGTVVAWEPFAGLNAAETNVPAGLANVTAIAAGNFFSLALQSSGKVVAWGKSAFTNLPVGATNITAISVNNASTGQVLCQALRADGRVFAWGSTGNGETNPPSALPSLTSSAIAAGTFHGLALINDGSPQILQPPIGLTANLGRDVTLRGVAVGAAPLSYQWLFNGTNIDGATNSILSLPSIQIASAGGYQLFVSNALGSAISIPAPVNVISNATLIFLTQNTATPTNLYQGGKFTIGGITVQGNGPLRYQWFFSRTNNGFTPVAGATNDTLLKDPALAFDTGNYYLAVSNLTSGFTSAPVSVRVLFARGFGYTGMSNPPVNVTNAVALATGGNNGSSTGHYLALGADGKVTAWANYFQTSGFSGETNLSALSNSIVTAIAASSLHTLALKSDGTVAVFGGGATNVPAGLNGVTAIACGTYHDLALKSDGTVVGWLTPNQINYGQATNTFAATNIVAIAAGLYHSLGLRADGTVMGWGNSDGTTQIPANATNIIAIAAGNGASVALRGNGTVVQWGNGLISYPVPSNLSNVVAISASSTHVTALKNDGTVVTWGYVYIGLASNNIPYDLTNVIGLASSGDHDIALFGTRAPAFTVQPWNRAVTINPQQITYVTLTGKVSGVQPMSYQWRLNGTNYPGATNDSLTLRYDLPQTPAGTFQLVASNSYGVAVSKPAKVTIVIPLAVALDTVNANGVATWNWLTSGSTPWYGQTNYVHFDVTRPNPSAARSGGIGGSQETILQTTLATNFPGTVSFWWKISSEQFFDTLEFRVNGTVQASISGEVDWQFASVPIVAGTNVLLWRYSKDSSFDAGLDAAFVDQVTFLSAPVINLQPSGVVANLGQNISLRVVATGTPQLGYQWLQNGNPVGGNTSTLALSSVARAQGGTYSVLVTNAGGMAISSNAAVLVKVPQLLGTPMLLPDGSLQLTSSDANGGQISPSDLANFEAQASTNLLNWISIPDGLRLTNGLLQLNDATRTNFASRYYRIVEH